MIEWCQLHALKDMLEQNQLLLVLSAIAQYSSSAQCLKGPCSAFYSVILDYLQELCQKVEVARKDLEEVHGSCFGSHWISSG